jgi:hypothetical protein
MQAVEADSAVDAEEEESGGDGAEPEAQGTA